MTQELMEDDLVGTGGLRIFVRSWRPEGKVRGVVAIVHGFNSHSGYYLWAAEQLVASGLAVYALDLRGRGLSDGKRFFVEKFSEYVDDVENLVTFARAREPGLPIFLLGHSAGGVIAAVYALEHQAALAGLICESFAFRVPAPAFALRLVRGLSHIAPNAPVQRLKNKDFSRDRRVVQAMDNDPLIANETEPAMTVAEMARADQRLEKEFPLIRLPLLILHGTADKATKPSGSMRFHASAGSSDKTLKLYQGHVHDLLNDIDRDVVMADIRMWLDAHLPVSRIRLATPRSGLGILR